MAGPKEAELRALAEDIIARQPFSRWLGTEVLEIAPGKITMGFDIHDGLTQHLGMVHGGVVASLADMGIGFAAGPLIGEGAVTQEFKINYLRPGLGERLIVRAEVLTKGKNQCVVRSDVYAIKHGVEKLCAAAQGTMVRASAGKG